VSESRKRERIGGKKIDCYIVIGTRPLGGYSRFPANDDTGGMGRYSTSTSNGRQGNVCNVAMRQWSAAGLLCSFGKTCSVGQMQKNSVRLSGQD
jgi:hypothetical protein